MSFSSPDSLALGSLGADAGIPSLNTAEIPANVRDGNKQARQAYVEGLAFEQVLVNQMTQQMASTLSGSDPSDGSSASSSDGSSDGSDSSAGGLTGGSAYASLIPQALTQGIMAGGGLGIAEEFAADVDPSINLPKQPVTGTVGGSGQTSAKSGQVGE